MPIDPLGVTVQISAASYQKTLAESLHSAGMLRQAIDLVPYLEIREPDGDRHLEKVKDFPAYTLAKRIVWGVWRRLPGRMRPGRPASATVWLLGPDGGDLGAPGGIFF